MHRAPSTSIWAGAAILLAGFALSSPALAKAGPFVTLGPVGDTPLGYVELCHRDSELCRKMEGDSAPGHPAAPAKDVQPSLRDSEQGATGSVTLDAAAIVEAPAVCDHEIVIPGRDGLNDNVDAQPFAFEPVSFLPFFTDSVETASTACVSGKDVADSVQPTVASIRPALIETETRNSAKGQYATLSLALIKHLNTAVNRSVTQITDQNLYGTGEYWTRPSHNGRMAGDCEDIAIEKRMRLIEMGADPRDLTLAVVFSQQWGLHTILVAHLADGDFVLDSLSYQLRRWDQTDYRWLRIQSRQDPREWRTIPS